MSDSADPLESSWELLRRNSREEDLPTTMTGLEAIERICRALAKFSKILGHTTLPMSVCVCPVPGQDGLVNGWQAYLDDIPASDSFQPFRDLRRSNKINYETPEDALEALFQGVLTIFMNKQGNLKAQIEDLHTQIDRRRKELLELERLQKAMGAYDRQQLTLFTKSGANEWPRKSATV